MRNATTVDRQVDRYYHHRFTGMLLAAAMLAACGGDKQQTPDTWTSTGAVTTPLPANAPSGTKATRAVTFAEGEAAFSEQRYSEAVVLFEQYVTDHPDNAWGHYMLGLSTWKSGDLVRAESSLVRSLELEPKHVKSLLNLSRVLLDAGRPRDARKHVTAALALDSSSSEGYRLLGRARAALNQPNEAMTAYRLALSRDPGDVWSMNNLGLLLVQQERYEEAVGPLARAVQLDSSVAVFHNNLGIALEHTGHFVLATQSYQRALGADSGYTKALLSLSRVNGRKEDEGLPVVDLAVAAETFDKEIRSWPGAVVRKEPERR